VSSWKDAITLNWGSKTGEGLGSKTRSLVVDMVSFSCPLDIHMQMWTGDFW
jgi:hypothetical protein